jgi:hypothetical protein
LHSRIQHLKIALSLLDTSVHLIFGGHGWGRLPPASRRELHQHGIDLFLCNARIEFSQFCFGGEFRDLVLEL